MKANPYPNDRGETLLELLITVAIMGVAVVTLVGGIATSIRMSDIHRKQATAGEYVRVFAEAIETYVTASPTKYAACANKDTYTPAYTADPAYTALVANPTYTVEITKVRYWNGSSTAGAFAGTCGPGTEVPIDTGVQQVSLVVRAGNTVAETLDIIIRKPCSSADPCTT
jgi:type II secretory pathway pseudopilin PulG